MDRFTTHNGKIVDFKGDMDTLADALLRLSKYEDTGLLPEEVAKLQKQSKRMEEEIKTLEERCDEIFSYATEQMEYAKNLKSDLRKAREMKDRVDYYADLTLARVEELLKDNKKVELIALKGENVLLKAEVNKAKKEILALKKQIEGLLAKKQEESNLDRSNLDRFLESLNGAINCSEARVSAIPVNDTPVSDAKLTPKKKIVWEAD